MLTPKIATLIATLTATLLAITKLVIGLLSGSVAVLASAIDSLLDVIISVFNFFALHKAEKPANQLFNYGYGKIESLASLIEGSIIALSGGYIFYQSILKLNSNEKIAYFDFTLWVMIFSTSATLILVIFLSIIAKKTKNQVLQADLLHYKTDLFSNGAVLISLALIYWTKWEIIDGILGILVAIYVIFSALQIIKNGVLNLMDHSLDENLLTQIKTILNQSPITSYHDIKSRLSGNTIFLEMHLVFDENISLLDAHALSEEIEEQICKIDPSLKWEILSHLDPYDDSLTKAQSQC